MRLRCAAVVSLAVAVGCSKKDESDREPGPPPQTETETLEPAPVPPDALEAIKMVGPADSLEAYCADRPACATHEVDDPAPQPPYRALRWVDWRAEQGMARGLAVQLEPGWYFLQLYESLEAKTEQTEAGIDSFELRDAIAGGAPELLIEVSRDETMTGHEDELWTTSSLELFVCGLGPSGAPSCIRALVAEASDGKDDPDSSFEYSLNVLFDESGNLVLSHDAPLPIDATADPGTYPLHFP